MAITKEEAIKKAKADAANRLGIDEKDVTERSVDNTEFPDTALGASTDGEMSGSMLTSGWRIKLEGNGQTLEYRADKHQVRLFGYKGKNYRI
jgi:hypothetical protein